MSLVLWGRRRGDTQLASYEDRAHAMRERVDALSRQGWLVERGHDYEGNVVWYRAVDGPYGPRTS